MTDIPMQAPSLGRAAASGAFWLGLTQVVRLFFTLIGTMVIARVLTPSDYGVIAMTAPLFALISMLRDFGLSAATIQARTLTEEHSNSLFWTNTAASTALAVIVLAISPLVGWFYNDGRPASVTAAGAAAVMIGGLALQPAALLDRDMRFRSVATIEMLTLVVTYGVAVVLAIALRNYWALFLGMLAGAIIQCVLNWRASNFRPGRPDFRGIGELARFGGHVAGFNILNLVVRNFDTVLVARFSGAAEAGIYDRSYRLLMLPLSSLAGPLGRLLQPTLREIRDEPARYRTVFNGAIRALALILMPPIAISAALAKPFMLLVLGPQWVDAGGVYFWLALVGLMQPIYNPLGLLYLTTGRSAEFMRLGAICAGVTSLSFIAAAPYGAKAMAAAFFASSLLLLPLRFANAVRDTPVRLSDLYSHQFLPLAGAAPVALAASSLSDKLPFVPLFIGATTLTYFATIAATSVTKAGRESNIWLMRFFVGHALAVLRGRQPRAAKL